MDKKERVLKDIDLLRDKLTDLIKIKEELIDEEVVRTSKLLDILLNHYNDLINTKDKQF
ncbi:Spo0E family sporulation regulatory protein-aspartic acid phosphatase [Maledivibacter halophilus]|uniref:Spo0E like sporulation regulatory protein n=1 Tax=Maledivibacter halophilus TaxID=36842 RepID=A0A1T5L4A2_9FIRM|nr:aspartyl-phosphate phosphatase Spo0E family protein [Maledivibacter halophilus]SKC70801.1 Spo0E like sporulation regulatory protein [Maledivibacter halophilus]